MVGSQSQLGRLDVGGLEIEACEGQSSCECARRGWGGHSWGRWRDRSGSILRCFTALDSHLEAVGQRSLMLPDVLCNSL